MADVRLIFSLVRSKAIWELYESPAVNEKPPQRTGHACVTFENKIIMCVFNIFLRFVKSFLLFFLALVVPMVNITITILGLSILRLANGRNCNVSDSSHHLEKVTQRRS